MKLRRIKRIISLVILIFIIFIAIFLIYRHLQPRIKSHVDDTVSIVVFDDDYMNAERLRALDCEFYKTTGGYREFMFNPDGVDDTKDYGNSFVLSIPIEFDRKNGDEDFELYYKVQLSSEAEECVYIIDNNYIAGIVDSPYYRDEKKCEVTVDLYGCTCGLDDDELIGYMKSLSLTVEVIDSENRKYEEEIPLDLDNMSMRHRNKDDEELWQGGPFFVNPVWP